jgi:peroxiredoxin Q/BCP
MAQLKAGDRAPDFTATTAAGRPIRLSDYLGQRGLVIFFYPKDGTPVCTQEACAFRDSYDRFVRAGMEVIGVSGDRAERHQDFAREHRLPFPLISDQDGAVRKAFGVPRVLGILPGRVTFIIDREGTIRHVYSALLASDEHVRQAMDAVGISGQNAG